MIWRRLKYLLPWTRRAAERDMQDELRSIAELGDPRELGNLAIAAENARSELGWTRLEQTGQDIRYALRSLRKHPGFTATAVLSLALGIGANTALFTLIDAVNWRLLPVRDPEQLLLLNQRVESSLVGGFTYRQYTLIRDNNQVLDLAAYSRARINISIDGSVEPTADGQLVSGQYFSLLGVRPVAGRLLGPEDDRAPMGHPVAVLSYRYWKTRFDGDPNTVGRQITLSGMPFTVVGVTPPEFFGVEVGTAPQVFVPTMMQPAVMPAQENLLGDPILFATWLKPVARLRPGVSQPAAEAALSALAAQADWRPQSKFGPPGTRMPATLELSSAATGLSDLRNQFSLPLRILMGMVGIVLLIACANTGNLVLARSAARRAEFALRLAIGASRSRLIRQVLIEGLVLSAIAGAAGIGLAYWATHALVSFVSTGRTAIVLDLAPDLRVLTFTAVVSALTGLLFAIAPAIRASRLDLALAQRKDLPSTRHALGGPRPARFLVVTQVALSLILLIAAGLFVRSLQRLNGQQDRSRVLTVRVEPRGSDQRGIPGTTDRLDRIYRGLLADVERVPGVKSASLARSSPLTPFGFGSPVTEADGTRTTVPILMTYPHYFATMDVPLLRGRDFDDRDLRPDSPRVVLVNDAFVRDVLKGQEALGTRHGLTMDGQPLDVIGVVQDSRFPNLREPTLPVMYQTFRQTRTGRGQMVLHVNVAGSLATVVPELRNLVQRIDRDLPMFDLRSLADEIDAVLIRERLIATLSGFFGLVALALVCVGLYGLMAFSVSRRTAEIGIRVALGADRGAVRWMIARETLVLILAGIAIGLPAAWAIARLASSQVGRMLFQLTPSDPVTMAGATALLIAVAMGAGLIPARRAARIDPIEALRND